jgi:regulator of nonsense transcripts 2
VALDQVVSALHQRFPPLFTEPLTAQVLALLQAPSKAQLATLSDEQREKDESARVLRQRGMLRVLGEMEAVALVKGDGETTFNVFKELVSLLLYVSAWLVR